jgi:hypothetical protein
MYGESQVAQEGIIRVLAQIGGQDRDAVVLLHLVAIGPGMLTLSPESGSHTCL